MNIVAAVAYHICLALPAAFTQPGDHIFAEPCTYLETPGLGATPSSGSGPRVDPPLAEEVPDMADTESPLLLRERISDCCS